MLNITEVRVKLMEGRSDRLRAFCSMTIDNDFVVHDLRVIEGKKGKFVAMPSRKLADSCPQCGGKNHLRASYCNDCGTSLDEDRAEGRKLHVDVAHPINTPCREHIQDAVLEAYEEDIRRKEEGNEPKHIYLEEDLDALGGGEETEVETEEQEPVGETETDETEEKETKVEDQAETEEQDVEESGPSRDEQAEKQPAETTSSASTPPGPQKETSDEKKEEEATEEEEDEFYKGIF